MRSPDRLTDIINQSGFPLQLAVEDLVTKGEDVGDWTVLSSEAGWSDGAGGGRFVDLVLEDRWKSSVLVVECKRVLEADWVFLSAPRRTQPTCRTRLWISNTPNHGREHFGYFDAECAPESYEAMFCVVPGQDSRSRPMLERVAAEVLSATEALAAEEHALMLRSERGIRFYTSIILTTARLHLSSIDPSTIDLDSASAQGVAHEEVPWIRFRKAFALGLEESTVGEARDFRELAAAKERGVFVVNVSRLREFLKAWSIRSHSLQRLMHPG